VGLRILHRSTIKHMVFFDPPFRLPPQLNIHGPNPLSKGVWQGGGLGFRWDETIPMQN
jgi:taurine dioxygenase